LPKPKSTSYDFDDDDISLIPKVTLPTVISPAGAEVPLSNQEEVDFYNTVAAKYQDDNKFANISDLLELDRLLNYEIMCFRWSNWLMRGYDYNNEPIMSSLSKDIQLYSKEIRDIKTGLGIDKKSRDKDRGSTTAEFWANLVRRAGEFGVHRNEQTIAAHTILKEFEGLVTLHYNSTDVERTQFKCHADDLLQWFVEKAKEFDKIDEAFRLKQRIWIREIN